MKGFADKLPPFVVLKDFTVFIMDRATPGKIQKKTGGTRDAESNMRERMFKNLWMEFALAKEFFIRPGRDSWLKSW